ncbi:MAG TPA: hypothetical protein VLI41_01640 [Phenylobacterium sp.]|uniref:hypothetical protein n=1 Tax=Phenylobacterium sp. TaxID=1871053 RepID=UPI002CE89654|nr:hypothetical protein [Phenylobacterium sp.]HSV01881.1 hypothetical protein [Phenylobacterium sp.]
MHNRQAELDFVDIDTDCDTRLFVDPYAIDIRGDAWSSECSRHLRSFFSALINALRQGQDARAEHLASHLHEMGETYLGMSSGTPRGRGIGREQALQILDALRNSRAVQTGLLSELAEAELFIEGIGSDKISDLTSNILRGPFLEYTRAQANLWGMPLERNIALAPIWDPNREDWVQGPRETLMVEGHPVILVPKFSVRRVLTLNSQEFYNNHMVTYLQQEYQRAGQALVSVLRSGERKVYKKDVKEHHPKSKPALAEFAEEHPDVLALYKRIAGAKGALEAEDFEKQFDEAEYAEQLCEALSQIPPGNAHASEYHAFCVGALTFLFFPDLIRPVKEREIDQGRKRIDIAYTNAARDGFFDMALRSPQMRAIEIPVECKNYRQDIANPELDQLTGRFSHVRGFLGLLCCRSFDDKARFVERCKDAASHRGHYVIVLDDDDLRTMLRNVSRERRPDNDAFLRRRHAEVIA